MKKMETAVSGNIQATHFFYSNIILLMSFLLVCTVFDQDSFSLRFHHILIIFSLYFPYISISFLYKETFFLKPFYI